MTSPILFITGTDTDVGKTMLSLLVLRVLAPHGAVYLKPIQTGTVCPDTDSDPAFLAMHLPGGLPRHMTPCACIQACRPRPKAPLFAGDPVHPEDVLAFVQGFAAHAPLVVVEGAGGVYVPITSSWTMLDLARKLDARVLVAARAGLGTINHTLLTLQAITAQGLSCLGVVLGDPHDATPEHDRRENENAIALFSGQRVWGTIGHIADPAYPAPEYLALTRRILSMFLPPTKRRE